MLARGTVQLATDIISCTLFSMALSAGQELGHQTTDHCMSVAGPAL